MVAYLKLQGKSTHDDKGGNTMTNRNNNRKQPHTGGNKADTEFGGELTQSKKARKQAARDSKK